MEINLTNLEDKEYKEILESNLLLCKKQKRGRLIVLTDGTGVMKNNIKKAISNYKASIVESMFNENELIIDFV